MRQKWQLSHLRPIHHTTNQHIRHTSAKSSWSTCTIRTKFIIWFTIRGSELLQMCAIGVKQVHAAGSRGAHFIVFSKVSIRPNHNGRARSGNRETCDQMTTASACQPLWLQRRRWFRKCLKRTKNTTTFAVTFSITCRIRGTELLQKCETSSLPIVMLPPHC